MIERLKFSAVHERDMPAPIGHVEPHVRAQWWQDVNGQMLRHTQIFPVASNEQATWMAEKLTAIIEADRLHAEPQGN